MFVITCPLTVAPFTVMFVSGCGSSLRSYVPALPPTFATVMS